MPLGYANIVAGWLGFLAGALSGFTAGIFFHREDWLGGYTSWRRRLMRLGHVACFALALINFAFAFTVQTLQLEGPHLAMASNLFIVGLATMPPVCYLSAFHRNFRYLFPVPVACLFAAVVLVVFGGLFP
jgi:hypothetical protein